MNQTIKNFITTTALGLAYSARETNAAIEFHLRKTRRSNPPGTWDNAGRFYAAERTDAVEMCRAPSRAYPYSQMTAAPSLSVVRISKPRSEPRRGFATPPVPGKKVPLRTLTDAFEGDCPANATSGNAQITI